jgi:glutamine---fructose-6-phosphate transaminase (isomerizing)
MTGSGMTKENIMCGIVGYIGSKEAKPILMEGLKSLEYRGYDSAGLAFLAEGDFNIIRAKGKLQELAKELEGKNWPANLGIGHTRWATHGKPDVTNAHPHYTKDVALVHNGIIENYRELKSELIEKGHEILSETDTEIICHLIQDFYDKGSDFFTAIQKTLDELKGAYSLVILERDDPDKIYTARKGSPLVVGQKEGESFVASDIPALLSHTNEVAYLHDHEMAILSRAGIHFYDFSGNTIDKEFKTITWTATQAEKSGYKHFMLKEIHEQPRVLADTLLSRVDRQNLKVDLGDDVKRLLRKYSNNPMANIQIVACGTSWHAGLVARYWFEGLAKIPVRVGLSSEFRYRHPLVNENTLVIAISQSGETADTLAAINESKKLGAKVLSICNVMESSITRESDATLYTLAGPEIGVASTKAFTTQMAVLYLVAVKLAFQKDLLTETAAAQRLQALIELPSNMKKFLANMQGIPEMTEHIYKKEHCYFLGRGIEYPIALEGALKLKEISYVHAEGYAGGEMKHGPIALIEEDIPVVACVLRDSLYEKMLSNVQEIKARGARIFALVTDGDTELAKQFDQVVYVPKTHPDLYPFFTILPLQMLAYQVADRKGTDVDQPRNLAKSVTVE